MTGSFSGSHQHPLLDPAFSPSALHRLPITVSSHPSPSSCPRSVRSDNDVDFERSSRGRRKLDRPRDPSATTRRRPGFWLRCLRTVAITTGQQPSSPTPTPSTASNTTSVVRSLHRQKVVPKALLQVQQRPPDRPTDQTSAHPLVQVLDSRQTVPRVGVVSGHSVRSFGNLGAHPTRRPTAPRLHGQSSSSDPAEPGEESPRRVVCFRKRKGKRIRKRKEEREREGR